MNSNELREKTAELYSLFEDIKREIRQKDPSAYEQWKAGGFLVDEGIISMYPALQTVADNVADAGDDQYDEDDDEDDVG